MVPLKYDVDSECFLVTKHSLKGKYKRILYMGDISTYNPHKFDVTNRWVYSDIVAIAPVKTGQNVWFSLSTQLEITPCSLDQLYPTANKTIASNRFKDIEDIIGKPEAYTAKSFLTSFFSGLGSGNHRLRQFHLPASVRPNEPPQSGAEHRFDGRAKHIRAAKDRLLCEGPLYDFNDVIHRA